MYEDIVLLCVWVVVFGGVFGCFMVGMNVYVINVLLFDICGLFGVSFEEGLWIIIVYLVVEIVVILFIGWFV